jgi:hypothetical protein
MPSVEASKLDSMMKKVEGLLAKADHPNTPPPEADTARAMAERIMVKYKIEEEHLIKRGELKVDQFNVLFKRVSVAPYESPYADMYGALASYALNHCGGFGVWVGMESDESGRLMRVLEFIGYEADVRYAEALFMQARLVFADRMEPKVDPALSDAENVYRMRSAGMERIKVAKLMGWEKGGAKVTRLYKQACADRGEDPTLVGRDMNVKDYREAYISGFQNQFWDNLRRARMAVDTELDGGGLVLHDRKGRIQEAMYERYPSLRPSKTPATTRGKVKPYRWTKADQKRADRMYSGAGQAGMSAGKRAADEVNIKGQTPKRRLGE